MGPQGTTEMSPVEGSEEIWADRNITVKIGQLVPQSLGTEKKKNKP